MGNGTKWLGNSFIYLLIMVAVVAIFVTLFSSGGGANKTTVSDILAMAKNGEISEIVVDGDKLIVTPRLSPNEKLSAAKEPGSSVFDLLAHEGIEPASSGIQIEVKGAGGFGSF